MAQTRFSPLALCLCLCTTALVLSGCGGGGGGGGSQSFAPSPPAPSPPPPPPPPPSPPIAPTWQSGVFQPAASFLNRCEVVRNGVDIEGSAFPDTPGSLLLEKFWLRSWTQETYLWNDEVTDRDPAATPSRRDYFALLRTFAKTASGKDKDDFHFSEPTSEALARRNSAPRASYGAEFVLFSSTRPRDIRVQYTEPNSPAAELVGSQARLGRGARLISVNGIDVINGATTQAELDALNAALFPANAGVTTTFIVRDANASTDRTVTVTSASIAQKPVNRTRVLSTPTGNVGYMLFNTFSPSSSEVELRDAIVSLQGQNITDLVVDLRYNGGGLLAVAGQLGYMVAGPTATNGKAFERLRFNARSGNTNPVTGRANDPQPFYSTGLGFSVPNGTPLPSLNLRRVFVLSTGETCSASEAVINGLRGIDIEVILVGTTTCGKPYGFYPAPNCGETYYSIQFQGQNHKGFGDYADGFAPANSTAAFPIKVAGCAVSDDYTKELGDPQEAMLAAALGYRASGTCPAPATAMAGARALETDRAKADGELRLTLPPKSILETNRDMRMPRQ